MQWSGDGLIIGVRKHGETSVIVEAVVWGRGRHLGLVRGGRSTRMAAILQPGNSVHLTWRARLDEHLGVYTVELDKPRAAALISDREALYTTQLLCAHLRLLPERDPHDRLLEMATTILDGDFNALGRAQILSFFELALLDELGFGLDLSACAVSGATKGLAYVSPKSGRAVTAEAGQQYLDRLLPLPAYFGDRSTASLADILQGFRLTGHFLQMHVWEPRNLEPPPVRDQLLAKLQDRASGAVNSPSESKP
ncbi:MAG: DNA repair protein RecO [Hyphomicrobiaceae bacterium]|nr:DNA repair protein RecO [Hyphomicrobiaceae bacterium]